jgi:hypothetical protein
LLFIFIVPILWLVPVKSGGPKPQGEVIAMPHVPHWIGFVGLLVSFIMCGALLFSQLWLFVLTTVLGLALVVLESRYERGLIRTRRD